MKISGMYSTACLVIFVTTMFGSAIPVHAQTETAGAKGPSDAEIAPLMKKTLGGIAGKESLMFTVE